MYKVRFMSLTGKFEHAQTQDFATIPEILAAIKAYAEPAGYTNIKLVDDEEEPDCFRFTGRTPGGRGGRNIAFADGYDVPSW